MGFKYSVIGDNTKENREHLDKLWYDISCPCVRFKTSSLFTDKDREVHTFQEEELGECLLEIKQGKCDLINCIGNPALFQAVTAMRDNSDELQYFTDGASWLKIPIGYDIASFLYTDWDGDCALDDINKWHKATLSELQAHFKQYAIINI